MVTLESTSGHLQLQLKIFQCTHVLVLEPVCQQLSFLHLLEVITLVTLATMELAGLATISTEMILSGMEQAVE